MPEKPPTPDVKPKGGSVTARNFRIKKPRLDMKVVSSLNVTSNCQMIRFDADFECANCDQVRRVHEKEYHLFMRGDSNSARSLQWFAFRMRNAPTFTGSVKLLIGNFTKVRSLYESGM